MKQYDEKVFGEHYWEGLNLYDGFPSWSCYCILDCDGHRKDTQPEGITGYRAYSHCRVCNGHGYMPIPPSEVGII